MIHAISYQIGGSGTHTKMSDLHVLIPKVASNITFVGATLCSIFGTLFNATALWVILKGKQVKNHCTSPVLFFQGIVF